MEADALVNMAMDQERTFKYMDIDPMEENWRGLLAFSDGGRRSPNSAAAGCSIRAVLPDLSTKVVFAMGEFYSTCVTVPEMERRGIELAASFVTAALTRIPISSFVATLPATKVEANDLPFYCAASGAGMLR